MPGKTTASGCLGEIYSEGPIRCEVNWDATLDGLAMLDKLRFAASLALYNHSPSDIWLSPRVRGRTIDF